MSATNRGVSRNKYDFYETPRVAIDKLFDNYDVAQHGTRILEPSAGSGAVCRVCRERIPESEITGVELQQELIDKLQPNVDACIQGSFFSAQHLGKYDIIIGNPPYSLAQEFVEKSLGLLNTGGALIFLLRTAFLESQKRFSFWQRNQVNGLLILSERPSFTGKGTDATSYAWFIWIKGSDKQFIKVI